MEASSASRGLPPRPTAAERLRANERIQPRARQSSHASTAHPDSCLSPRHEQHRAREHQQEHFAYERHGRGVYVPRSSSAIHRSGDRSHGAHEAVCTCAPRPLRALKTRTHPTLSERGQKANANHKLPAPKGFPPTGSGIMCNSARIARSDRQTSPRQWNAPRLSLGFTQK